MNKLAVLAIGIMYSQLFVLLVSVESSDAGVETKYDRLDNSF